MNSILIYLTRKYNIDLDIIESSQLFINFFKNKLDLDKFYKHTGCIEFYKYDKCKFKAFIHGALHLLKFNLISAQDFDSFMEILEQHSKKGYGRKGKRVKDFREH